MKLIKSFMVVVVITGLSMFASGAWAATGASILYQETDLGGGLWEYSYTFENTSSLDESMYKVFLGFGETSNVSGSPLPSDWIGIWAGDFATSYLVTMSLNPDTYIGAGDSMDGFVFTVDTQLGDLFWYAEFMDENGGLSYVSGNSTSGVPVVPEPISTILFLTGGAAMAVRSRFRKRSSIA